MPPARVILTMRYIGVWSSSFSISKNRREDQSQFVRFTIELSCLRGQGWLRDGDHPQKKPCLFSFLLAPANGTQKIFLRNTFVRLAVVCTYTCPRAHQLVNEAIIGWIAGQFLSEPDYSFSELRCPFLKVERMAAIGVRLRLLTYDPISRRPHLVSHRLSSSLDIGVSLGLGRWCFVFSHGCGAIGAMSPRASFAW